MARLLVPVDQLFLCPLHRQKGQVRFEKKQPAKKASKKAGECGNELLPPSTTAKHEPAPIGCAHSRREELTNCIKDYLDRAFSGDWPRASDLARPN